MSMVWKYLLFRTTEISTMQKKKKKKNKTKGKEIEPGEFSRLKCQISKLKKKASKTR